ncbi:MAG: hypothetical protein EOP53_28170 [Sphingobacteriales bacterium]|nr:MAG: hypothetical protein EOP53_28170 [Sphingobacteriales bacterium]
MNACGLQIDHEQFTTFYNVFVANERCYRTYEPSPLCKKIQVSLYRAAEDGNLIQAMPDDYGWGELLANKINVHDIKANHYSILEKNHSQTIARQLIS